jgi:hypothetical protein
MGRFAIGSIMIFNIKPLMYAFLTVSIAVICVAFALDHGWLTRTSLRNALELIGAVTDLLRLAQSS